MTSLAILIPMPPTTNHLYANKVGRGGRSAGRTISKGYAAWLEEAGWHARTAWAEAGKPILKAPLKLVIRLKLDRKSDISNRIKAIEDMMVKTIPDWPDDCWNDDVRIIRDADIADGAALVGFYSITGPG